MVRPKLVLDERKSLLVKTLCFFILALTSVETCEVIEADCRVGVLCPQLLLPNGESLLIRFFGFSVLTLILIENSKPIEGSGDIKKIYLGLLFHPRDTQRVSKEGENALKNWQRRQKYVILGENE